MRTSYKKNRPFDFKLIDLVEPNPVLYQRQTGLSNYEAMKAKNVLWDKIAQLMDRNAEFCLMRWNNLRYQFQKELRRAEKLCPKLGVIRGSTWPYLERLRFLTDLHPKAKPITLSTPIQLQLTTETADPIAAPPAQEIWQSYNECVVLHVSQVQDEEDEETQTTYIDDDERYIIEEIIEEPSEQIIREEIIYEESHESSAAVIVSRDVPGISLDVSEDSSASNFQKMDRILAQLKGLQRERAERRIMAFLLKCQLRSLVNEPVDDLVI